MEDDIVVLEEEQQADPGLKLACDDNDIFEDGITDSQLERAINALTQEDPEGSVQSPEVEEIPPPEPMEVAESEQDSADLGRDRQDMGLVDPIITSEKATTSQRYILSSN